MGTLENKAVVQAYFDAVNKGHLTDDLLDFMTEDEQGDDPVLVQQWIDDLRSIPPVPANPEKEAEWRVWEEKMRHFNVDAVRKQFEEGTP